MLTNIVEVWKGGKFMLKLLVAVIGALATTLAIIQGVNMHIRAASHPERVDFAFTAHQTHSRQITFRPARGNIRATGHQISGQLPTTYRLRRAVGNGSLTPVVTFNQTRNNAGSTANVLLGNQNALTLTNFRVDLVRDTVRGSANTFRLFVFIQ